MAVVDKGIPQNVASGLTAVVLGRGIELHKVVNMVGIIQRAYMEAHKEASWKPRSGLLLKGNDYKSGEHLHFNEAPVLIINCNWSEWVMVVKWCLDS